jgi:hypothetical protein
MSQEQLDYFSSWEKQPSLFRVWLTPGISAGVVVLANAASIVAALVSSDRDFGIALLMPAANLLMIVIGLCLIPVAKRVGGAPSAITQAVVSVVAPLIVGVTNVLILGRLVFPNGVPRC